MARRLRREFQGLESQLEPDAQAKQWRALIDKVLYDKGPGPKPIVEQLRLREKLRTLHARRDRYNQVRYERRRKALLQLVDRRHVIAAMAIGLGIVEASEGPLPRDLLIGAMAGDRRLTKKMFGELEGISEYLYPSILPWELDRNRITWEAQATVSARGERRQFESTLQRTDLPVTAPAPIKIGFPVLLTSHPDAPDQQVVPPAARAAS